MTNIHDENPPHLCQRCGYTWHSRPTGYTHVPKQCPSCKSYRWDVPPRHAAPMLEEENKIAEPEKSIDMNTQEGYN